MNTVRGRQSAVGVKPRKIICLFTAMEKSIEVSSSFKYICKEITQQCANRHIRNHFEFTELLKCLTVHERYLASRYFCNETWNIGSLGVLQIFQTLRILTATEFVLSISADSEQLQLILNDFLEAHFELLTNLFISASYDVANGIALGVILNDTIRNLFKDLLSNPNIGNLDYLETLQETLPADALLKVKQTHLSIVLELHSSTIREAFRDFTSWINEGVDELKLTKQLCEKLISHNAEEALAYLFKQSTTEHFKAWKFYIIMLQTIATRSNTKLINAIIKKIIQIEYLKARLDQIASVPCRKALLHLFLSARASLATTSDIDKNLNAYADWYKLYIGEMKFVLDPEKFQNIMKLLDECVYYEMELEYLQIHALIAISPPMLCSKLVQAYKNKCKSRLALLKSKSNIDPEQSITIDESD